MTGVFNLGQQGESFAASTSAPGFLLKKYFTKSGISTKMKTVFLGMCRSIDGEMRCHSGVVLM